MGLVHGRELLGPSTLTVSSPPRIVLLVALAGALACGRSREASTPRGTVGEPAIGDSLPARAATASHDSSATLARPIVPNGSPMPAAARVGGVPPYPGAVVWIRFPHNKTGLRSMEAFTPDPPAAVEAFYDSALGGGGPWKKRVAKDMVIYEKGEDQAAITVNPWDAAALPKGSAKPLQEANTAIGAAWRE